MMQRSSPQFKAGIVSFGASLWFFIISYTIGWFEWWYLVIFAGTVVTITQVFAVQLERGLDIFSRFTTALMLGSLFVFTISVYGICFRALRIDLLRLRGRCDTYWLKPEILKQSSLFKEY